MIVLERERERAGETENTEELEFRLGTAMTTHNDNKMMGEDYYVMNDIQHNYSATLELCH